ncbi:AbrB family transcriptional regulator [Yoonia sp. R2-816]|uniref:AbrB family transcriptional regulator n=1 Tax=Yoonia sp. R2-816 TaxID=3342638 RepID=UPI003728756A
MVEARPQILALILGLICGIVAYFAGLPLPWMLGPMIGNTVAAMMKAPVVAPARLRPFVIPVIGVMLGSAITAELLGQLGSWLLTLVLLPVFLACAAAFSYFIYRRVGGYDPVTAYFAAMPGGLNEMLIVGSEAGGDERRIALAHAARILVVIVFVALFFGLVLGVSGGSTAASNWVDLTALSVSDYVILAACAVAGAWLGRMAHLPAAPVFGPMILSGVAHVAGWVTVPPPSLFVIAAQVTMGTIIGTRFAGATIAEVRRDLSLAAVASVGMLVITLAFAEVLVWISGLPLAQAFLAYSPGGLTEMSLLTLAMDQDVAYVSVMHVIRITMVIGMAPLVFRWLRR